MSHRCIAVALVSVRNAKNSNYPSWENRKTNVETVSHRVAVFDKAKKKRKPNNQLKSDARIRAAQHGNSLGTHFCHPFIEIT